MFRIAAAIMIASVSTAMAAEWRVMPLAPDAYPPAAFAEIGQSAPDGLPDGLVATGGADIIAAWYVAPTHRYAHGILGDAVEAGGLSVRTAAGAELTVDLPENMVFEDRTPRIADLDSDGRAEVVTIRSSRRGGGGVAVYGVREGRLAMVAETEFIGRSNRWLNIAAIADITGDGRKEIAFVRTPHIGGTLRMFQYADGLTLLSEIEGFSNHAIGATEQRLSAVADIDGDGDMEVAVPSDSRSVLRIIDYQDGLEESAAIKLPARIEGPVWAEGDGEAARFVLRLRNGEVVAVTR